MFQEISYEMLEMNPFTAIGNDGFLVTAERRIIGIR
jgi:hypothetical protein